MQVLMKNNGPCFLVQTNIQFVRYIYMEFNETGSSKLKLFNEERGNLIVNKSEALHP